MYPPKTKMKTLEKYLHPRSRRSILAPAQGLRQTSRPSEDEGMKKLWFRHSRDCEQLKRGKSRRVTPPHMGLEFPKGFLYERGNKPFSREQMLRTSIYRRKRRESVWQKQVEWRSPGPGEARGGTGKAFDNGCRVLITQDQGQRDPLCSNVPIRGSTTLYT